MRFTLAALLLLLALYAKGQMIRKDSVTLFTLPGEKIVKVVSKYDRKNRIFVGWHTRTVDSATLYFQKFDYDGFPVLDTNKIAKVAIPTSKNFDFDLAIDTRGNSIVAWSQYDSISGKYKIIGCILDPAGKMKKDPWIVGTSFVHFVKTSVNAQGFFLISWSEFMNRDLHLKIQIFDANYKPESALISTYFPGTIEAHSYPVELTDSTHVAISWLLDVPFFYDFGSRIKLLNKEGTLINFPDEDYGYQEYFKQSFDMSFDYRQTFLSFSIFSESNYKKGTYVALPSRFNETQKNNIITIDTATSQITQIAQNRNGYAFMSWLTKSGEIKAQFFQNSSQPFGHPSKLWVDGNGLKAESMDVVLTDDNDATIIYAINSGIQASIILQRIRYYPMQETRETLVPDARYPSFSVKMLSSKKNHVVLWQHHETNKSAILAQVYDKAYNKIGTPVNVTGYKNHEQLSFSHYFNFDAAIDSLGNFMIAWGEYMVYDIFAMKFDATGRVKLKKFVINDIVDSEYKSPAIAANGKGDFIIVWNNSCRLKARLFRSNFDSGEAEIRSCFGQMSSKVVSMNNSGKFIVGFKSGYYDITFFMYNENLEQISTAYARDVLTTDGDMDLQLSEQDQIVITASREHASDRLIAVYRYDWSGVKLGEPVAVTHAARMHNKPALSINLNGDFCVLYQSYSDIPNTLLLQKFNKSGQKDGDAARVNTFIPSAQSADVTYYENEITATWISGAYMTYFSTGGYSESDVVVKGLYQQKPRQAVPYYQFVTIVEGDSLQFGLHYLKKMGRYTYTFETPTRDSTVVLTLNVTAKDPDPVTQVEDKGFGKFSIFPNPADTKVYVEGEEPILDLEVMDTMGRRHPSRFSGSELTLEGLSQGIYIIRIVSSRGEWFYKVLKRN